jgi:RNA 2',3'-cyclic 3'-phosphodiesterase
MTRMFVAVIPPESVIEDLEAFVGPRREATPFRWTQPEQWHLTLAFSADVPDRSYDDLVDRLGRAARKRRPVEARIAGGGAFPNVARAKVVYAGVQTHAEPGPETGAEELRRMATGARAAVARSGAEVDGQRFRPHLTLARVHRPVEATKFVHLLDAYASPTWTVDELALVASHLGEGPRNRARHEVVETFSLGRAGSGPAPADAPPRGR